MIKFKEFINEEADGRKRNRELYATGRISKDEFDKRMGYGKYKTKDNSKRLDGPGGIYKNLVKRYNEETEILEESDTALANKAKESGFSLAILKQVYKRGVAAWKVGHKPGTTPQQWGMARVNSFITGGRTRVKGDPDLWAKQKGNIKK